MDEKRMSLRCRSSGASTEPLLCCRNEPVGARRLVENEALPISGQLLNTVVAALLTPRGKTYIDGAPGRTAKRKGHPPDSSSSHLIFSPPLQSSILFALHNQSWSPSSAASLRSARWLPPSPPRRSHRAAPRSPSPCTTSASTSLRPSFRLRSRASRRGP